MALAACNSAGTLARARKLYLRNLHPPRPRVRVSLKQPVGLIRMTTRFRVHSTPEDDVERRPLLDAGAEIGRNENRSSATRRAAGSEPSPSAVSLFTPQVLLFFVFPAIGGMLFGYDIGATSGALLSMTSEALSGTSWYALSPGDQGLVVSLSLAGALGGSALALVFGDELGRRRELILGGALYFIGATLVYEAPGIGVVMLGRLMYGLGIGFSMHAAPAYIAETSPPAVRGVLISMKEAFIVGGILLGYLVSYLSISTVGGWRLIYGAAVPLSLVLMAGMTYLSESPRWLALKNRKEEAVASLSRTMPGTTLGILEAEVTGMMSAETAGTLDASSPSSSSSFWMVFTEPRYRRPLAVGLSLMLFQQITGQPSVLYYAARIFQDAGFASADSATGISVVLGVFKLVMTGVAVATVDSWGRRPLLLVGVSGIVASLLVLGGIQGDLVPFVTASSDTGIWLNVGALLLYVGAYQVSFGPISWLLCGEVFPLSVRGSALALATITNFASNFLVSLCLPTLQDTLGASGLYFAFAGVGVLALITIQAIVPETKGKSLEQIERLWD